MKWCFLYADCRVVVFWFLFEVEKNTRKDIEFLLQVCQLHKKFNFFCLLFPTAGLIENIESHEISTLTNVCSSKRV